MRSLFVYKIALAGAGLLLSSSLSANPLKIIVTSRDQATAHRYNEKNFAKQLKHDYRLFSEVSIAQSDMPDIPSESSRLARTDRKRVDINIARQSFSFEVCRQMPVIHLRFDRNRRLFSPVGLNLLENSDDDVRYPRFKNRQIDELWSLWREEIQCRFENKNLFEQHHTNKLILEIEIDTDGYIRKITDLGGAPKLYSNHCISVIFDIAARDWSPATINGKAVDSSFIICLGDY